MTGTGGLRVAFTGVVFFWRGPAPHHFVRVPAEESALLQEVAPAVSYGWGMVPVTATLGASTWTTSLFPQDGGYLLPVKAAVRRAEAVEAGDTVEVALVVAG